MSCYVDLAVGAPYYGAGAVFIYNGIEINQELSFKLSQVMSYMSDMVAYEPTLGSSTDRRVCSSAINTNQNQYP